MLKTKVVGLFAGIIGAMLIALWAENRAENAAIALADTAHERYVSLQLADEFRHTSMDLTRLARTYVATGDERYRQQYWDIVKWRNGEIPRPQSVSRHLYPGEQRKQSDMMRELGFSEQELSLLQQASQNSQALIATESQAMTTVRQQQLADGPFAPQSGESLQQFASRILFDQNYHNEVSQIMTPVKAFFAALETRTGERVAEATTQAKLWAEITLAIQFIVALITAGAIYAALKFLFEPLSRAVKAMQDIGAGNGSLHARLPVKGNDELAMLARGFNQFADNIYQLVVQVRSASSEVSASSGSMRASSDDSQQAIAQQQHTLNDASHAITQLVDIANNVAANASNAAGATTEADRLSQQGLDVVQSAIADIDMLSQDIDQAANAIGEVEQDSNTIATD